MGHQNVKKLIYSETLHKTESPEKKLTAQCLRRKFQRVGWWGGSIKMGKKIYRFKTESWAQDVSCANIIKIGKYLNLNSKISNCVTMGHQLQKNLYSETLHKTESPKKKLTAQCLRRKFERVGWWGGSIKMGKNIYRFKTESWAKMSVLPT